MIIQSLFRPGTIRRITVSPEEVRIFLYSGDFISFVNKGLAESHGKGSEKENRYPGYPRFETGGG